MWFRFVLIAPLVVAATLWASATLWIDGPDSPLLSGLLSAGFAGTVIAIFTVLRPFRRSLLVFCGLFLVVLAWWLGQTPQNDHSWQPDVAKLPSAIIEGDQVTIRNVRNFDYRSETDYTENWEERTYDLSRLLGVDTFLSYWGPTLIAHTIMSWEFDDGQRLAISIETRKEKGESYSAVLGFFHQFELYYVVADERDLIGLRTHHRKEDVYLYHLRTGRDTARALLLDYLQEINRLTETPRWYNALTHNCTTSIRHHFQHITAEKPFDWRLLANGRIDELAYSRGTIDTSLPFSELRRRSAITAKAQAMPADEDFSDWIRHDLPGGHEPIKSKKISK